MESIELDQEEKDWNLFLKLFVTGTVACIFSLGFWLGYVVGAQ